MFSNYKITFCNRNFCFWLRQAVRMCLGLKTKKMICTLKVSVLEIVQFKINGDTPICTSVLKVILTDKVCLKSFYKRTLIILRSKKKKNPVRIIFTRNKIL